MARNLEGYVKTPIIDRTVLPTFDIKLKWPQHNWDDPNLYALKQALLTQLGLELVPTNMTLEMLVVEKVK